jgi:nitrite reductase/ring-hydroxylating ferredoxin subunit
MAEFVEVAKIDQLPIGRARSCPIGDRRIALYHTPLGFFATDNTCPHRGGPLGEGDLLGNEIVCPWHFWSFDVTTGANVADPSLHIPTHEVKIEGERVLVRLP